MHSIVTSFGLDFIVRDQFGGDVDTIHGVRETGEFKNSKYKEAYESREQYDGVAYHHNEGYDNMIRAARETHAFIDDAYVPGNTIYYGKSSGLSSDRKANLDHVISAHEIYDDKARILADLDGVELANQQSNLQFTNEHLNKSMGDMSIEEYIQWREDSGNPLPPDVIEQMKAKDSAAREAYEERLREAYYSSDRFLIDATSAAAKRGVEMGLRQALGFVFIELWCACEDEIKALPKGVSFNDCFHAVEIGFQKGLRKVKENYREVFNQFGQGFVAGALASLTTTLINIFITTDKNMVRYIRHGCTTIVQVSNILLFNPDDLLLGDQLKSAMVSLTTGACVIAGTAVGNEVAKTPIGQHKEVGAIVQTFCASLVSGLLSCTLLIMVDRSKFMADVIKRLNVYGSKEHEIRALSEEFISIAAEVAQYDMNDFMNKVEKLNVYTGRMLNADADELHELLQETFEELDIDIPWVGDFDDFMSNPENCLEFD